MVGLLELGGAGIHVSECLTVSAPLAHAIALFGVGICLARAGVPGHRRRCGWRKRSCRTRSPTGSPASGRHPRVARLVKVYGEHFLSGRTSFYDELQTFNERASVKFERDQMLARIRKEADEAWTAKDLSRVADLLQPVRAELAEIESKRLAYAEMQIQSAVQAADKGA